MRYAGIIYNDLAAAPGVSLTFFAQGCPHKCENCHNPEAWPFDGGHEFTIETMTRIIKGLKANGIKRTLCIMGGEPLCPENRFLVDMVIKTAKESIEGLKVYVWTGYLYEDLNKMTDSHLASILKNTDVLVDGPYIDSERDITLPMRGSRNQRIINLREGVLKRASEQD